MHYLGAISKMTELSVCFQGKPFNITVIQVYGPTTNTKEDEAEWFRGDLLDFLELTPKKDVLFITGDCNAKVGSQEIPGVTDKFGLGVRNEAGQSLSKFAKRTHPLPTIQEKTTQGHHQMVNTEIRLNIFFAAKMEKLYTVSKNKTRS